MATILITDDDKHIRELISLLMLQLGHDVLEAKNGKEALQIVSHEKVDLLILDVMMPVLDGFEASKEIREFSDIPILMLTAKGETLDKVQGFSSGVDDYLVKPFEPLELEMRVKALLKRYKITTEKRLQIGKCTLYQDSLTAINLSGEHLLFPKREFSLLYKLASSPTKTFSREQLIEDIWGYDYEGDERTVDVHIKRIRERLSKFDESIQIETVWGLGYRLGTTK